MQKISQIFALIVVLLNHMFMYMFDSIKSIFKCKHKKFESEKFEYYSKESDYDGDYWMQKDRYYIRKKCKKCGEVFSTSVTKEEYIRKQRELKFKRIIEK
jgi:hypothetical protein